MWHARCHSSNSNRFDQCFLEPLPNGQNSILTFSAGHTGIPLPANGTQAAGLRVQEQFQFIFWLSYNIVN